MINDKDGFKKICKVSDLREKEGKRFLVDDVDIAVFKVDGNIYALPSDAPRVLRVNTKLGTLDLIGPSFEGGNKWQNG